MMDPEIGLCNQFIFDLIDEFKLPATYQPEAAESFEAFGTEYLRRIRQRDAEVERWRSGAPTFSIELMDADGGLDRVMQVCWYFDHVLVNDPLPALLSKNSNLSSEEKWRAVCSFVNKLRPLESMVMSGAVILATLMTPCLAVDGSSKADFPKRRILACRPIRAPEGVVGPMYVNKTMLLQQAFEKEAALVEYLYSLKPVARMFHDKEKLGESSLEIWGRYAYLKMSLFPAIKSFQGNEQGGTTIRMASLPELAKSNADVREFIAHEMVAARYHFDRVLSGNVLPLYDDTGLESLVSGIFSLQRIFGGGQKPADGQAAPQKQADTPRGRAAATVQFTLPFLTGISGEALFDLRESHREAFLDFRYQLEEIVSIARKEGVDSQVDLEMRVGRAVMPAIRTIDAELRAAVKKARLLELGVPVSAASAILLANVLSADVVPWAAAAAIGGTVATAAKAIADECETKEKLKGYPFYFVWKARSLGLSGPGA